MTGRADELALVATGINDMASGLLLRERIREAFGRFVSRRRSPPTSSKSTPPPVVAAELGGTRREVGDPV
jgi:adenylate cyclase